jgi:hypothetical protein
VDRTGDRIRSSEFFHEFINWRPNGSPEDGVLSSEERSLQLWLSDVGLIKMETAPRAKINQCVFRANPRASESFLSMLRLYITVHA